MSLKRVILLAAFPISAFLFFSSFSYYFFQDDWFVTNWARTGNFWSFFAFRTDIIYWRPLSMPLLFFITDKLFPLNAAAFHTIAFSFFAALILAVYKLFDLLLKDKNIAAVGAFLYATWPIHYISLSWFSTTAYIIGPLFMVWSYIFFKKNYILSFAFFLMSLASSEFALVLPAVFLISKIIIGKDISIKYLLPFFAIDLIYVLARFFIFPIPAKGEYELILTTRLLNNLIWYIAWAFGIPERFKELIFLGLPGQSLKSLLRFWQVTLPALVLIFFVLYRLVKSPKNSYKNYLFGVLWLLAGLSPVILLIGHSYPVYLSFAGIGFLFVILSAFKKANNFLVIALLALWIVLAYNSLKFTKNTHWIRNEQAISKAYTNFAKAQVPDPSSNSAFVIRPASIAFARDNNFVLVEGEDTLKTSLSGQNALQVIYNNPAIKSLFLNLGQDVDLPPDVYIYEITPQ